MTQARIVIRVTKAIQRFLRQKTRLKAILVGALLFCLGNAFAGAYYQGVAQINVSSDGYVNTSLWNVQGWAGSCYGDSNLTWSYADKSVSTRAGRSLTEYDPDVQNFDPSWYEDGYGCYGNPGLTFFGYSNNGKWGVNLEGTRTFGSIPRSIGNTVVGNFDYSIPNPERLYILTEQLNYGLNGNYDGYFPNIIPIKGFLEVSSVIFGKIGNNTVLIPGAGRFTPPVWMEHISHGNYFTNSLYIWHPSLSWFLLMKKLGENDKKNDHS